MDVIRLVDMEFYGYHGVYEAEQEFGQRFAVDVELYYDCKTAAETDDLDETLNYVEVYALVKEIVEERTYNLLEALAEAIAQETLQCFPIEGILVRVRKPHVSLGGLLRTVEIQIERWQEKETSPETPSYVDT